MFEAVQAVAVYEAGATPVEAVKVAVTAPAVVVEGAVVRPVGALTWLVSA
jgi:hypothetical protein